MKLLLSLFLIALAGILLLALVHQLAFLCLSRGGNAVVTSTVVHEEEDSDGGVKSECRIAIHFEVDGRGYEAGNLAASVRYAVGSELPIRYRRSNPHRVQIESWSTLFCLCIFAPMATGSAWLTVHWPL